MWRNGPIVWEGVGAGTCSVLHWRRLTAPQDDVVAIPERPLFHGSIMVVAADHPLASLGIADGVEDRVLEEERVAGEKHLGDEAGGEGGAEKGEVDVPRTPRVRVVLPRISARLGREEA